MSLEYLKQQRRCYRWQLGLLMALPLWLLWVADGLPGGWLWDCLNGIGFAALALCAYLFIERARPRLLPLLEGKFFLHWHRALGWLLLFLVTAHGLFFLLIEPTSVEYILPTAPAYMLLGLLAWLLLLYLCLSSLKSLRKAWFKNHQRYRLWHSLASQALLLCSYFHIIDSGFYLNNPHSVFLLTALLGGLLLYYGLNRLQQRFSLALWLSRFCAMFQSQSQSQSQPQHQSRLGQGRVLVPGLVLWLCVCVLISVLAFVVFLTW